LPPPHKELCRRPPPLGPNATPEEALTATQDVALSPSAYETRCNAQTEASSTACDTTSSSSARRYAAPATSAEDGGLVVAKTPSEYGSDSAYFMVVRRPLSVAAVYFGDFSASPVAHVRLIVVLRRYPVLDRGCWKLGSVAATTHKRWGMHVLTDVMNYLTKRM